MKFYMLICSFLLAVCLQAQQNPPVISQSETQRIEKTLSDDDMQGRATFTAGIEKAAAFIASEFKAAGLQPLAGSTGYLQDFTLTRSTFLSANANFDGQAVDPRYIVAFTSNPRLSFTQDSGYSKGFIKPGDNFRSEASKYIQSDKSWLILVDTSFSKEMRQMATYRRPRFKNDRSAVFVLSSMDPKVYSVEVSHDVVKSKLANVVGILPGKSKKDEYVIFSGHYDHLGIGKPDAQGDSVYNGANDDASGTTAVIQLARYFKQKGDNERTLVFAAFTAEEMGGYGSQYFSKQFDPLKVMAMFNIEMIGTESKWGINSAYITGYEKTDMGAILEKNLVGSPFSFHADPYTQENLFYRSDNATLARQGVPAHTISTSKMDNEPHYHKPSDEIQTLDLKNMTEIIRAIAISSTSIIAGKDTPSRVDTKQLK